MQPVERKKKRTLKHGTALAAAAAVLLFGSVLAALLWPKAESPGETAPAPAAENTADAGAAAENTDDPRTEPETPDEGGVPAADAGNTGHAETGHSGPEETEEEAPVFARGMLEVRQAEELASVTVAVRGQEPWTVVWDEAGDMRLKGSEDWAAKDRLSYQVRNALTSLAYEGVLAEDPAEYKDRLADFGLDDPYIVAEARYTDGKEITVRLGDEIPVEASVRYMLVDGDPRLFAVSHSLAEDLEIEKDMLHPVTQPEIYPVLLDRITIYGKDGKELAEWRLRGAVTDQDAGTNWEVTAPFRYCADETIIENMKTSAGNLRMGVYLGDATEERLAEYGLAEPEYRLELHMAAGSTGTVSDLGVYDVVEREGGTVALAVSRSGNELIDYALFGDEVFKVSHLVLAAFLDVRPENTAARYIAPVPLGSLESMTVSKNGEETVYTLERTGKTDPDTAEEIVVCRRNGEEIPREAFEAAYERLMTVTVSGRLPEGARWGEAHTKYAFRAVSGGTHTVELSSWDGLHDAVTVDGETRFYLVQRGAEFTYGQD